MAARPNTPLRPIIVKKVIEQAHGGHHGGAWKVAYADFVTAMMAFFLLMWLLGATTEKQRKALADYFAPTIVQTKQDTAGRSEEHTSELQSLMRISYAVFCLKKKKQNRTTHASKQQSYSTYHNAQPTTHQQQYRT